MLNIIDVILILCLIGCMIYIYWLHSKYSPKIIQTLPKKIPDTNNIDDMSFLKSNYDIAPSDDENIFGDTDTSDADDTLE